MKFKKKTWRYIWQRQTCSYNVRVPRFLGRHHVLDSSLWKKRFAFDTRFKSPSVKRQSRSPRGNSKLLDIFLISSNQLFNKMVILLTVFVLLAVLFLKCFDWMNWPRALCLTGRWTRSQPKSLSLGWCSAYCENPESGPSCNQLQTVA